MSGKVSGWVWDLDLPQNEKFVLLAYADHADHEGNNVFPSVKLVCEKTGYSRRSIQGLTKRLVDRGLLIPTGGQQGGRGISAHWRIPIKGANFALIEKRAQPEAERAQPDALKGATATAPEPSVNRHIEPSIKRVSSDKKTEWDKFLLAWARHFPHKVQPRINNLTLQKKLMVRLKDPYFKENYETALMQASGSDFINSGNWMDAGWFLKNDGNWEKCLDGKYDSNDKPMQLSKQQAKKDATKQGLYNYLKKEGVIIDDL